MTRNIYFRIALLLLGSAFVIFFRNKALNVETGLLFSSASLFFGIFVAFSINNSQTRLNKIIGNLKDEEGLLLFAYSISKVFDRAIVDRIREKIDQCLMAEIDYYLHDYYLSAGAFENLSDYIIKIDPRTRSQENAHDKLIDIIKEIAIKRKQTEVSISQPLSKIEWFTITVLVSVITFSIVMMNSGSLVSNITSVLLVSSALLLIFILDDMDSLKWGESTYIWESISNTFLKIGVPPYFPEAVSKRIALIPWHLGFTQIRVAKYLKAYPNVEEKNIVLVTK